jgi:hypothetical protein
LLEGLGDDDMGHLDSMLSSRRGGHQQELAEAP